MAQKTRNKEHNFLLTLKMDGKTIASRSTKVVEYNDNVIYSLRLNQLMIEMSSLIEEALKDNSIKEVDRLLERGVF